MARNAIIRLDIPIDQPLRMISKCYQFVPRAVTLVHLIWIVIFHFCTPTLAEECLGWPRGSLFDTYVKYENDDYDTMKINFSLERKILVGDVDLFYNVKKPSELKSYSVWSFTLQKEIYQCDVSTDKTECCKHREGSTFSKNSKGGFEEFVMCTPGFSIFPSPTLPSEKEYELVLQIRGKIVDEKNFIIWFHLTHAPYSYFSVHANRNVTVLCPQIAINGHTSDDPNLQLLINDNPETRNLKDELMFRTRENRIVSLSILGFMPIGNLFSVVKVLPNAMYWKEENVYHVKETPLSSMDRKLIHTQFSLRLQWGREYELQVYRFNFKLVLSRHISVILFLIYEPTAEMNNSITELANGYFYQNKPPVGFQWSKSTPTPAIRILRLWTTREAVFQVGEDKLITIENNEAHESETLFCEKRLTTKDAYAKTKRMFIAPQGIHIEMRNLTVEDSGLYHCRNELLNVDLILDYYVIVLQRAEDVSLWMTQVPLQPNDYPFKNNILLVDIKGQPVINTEINMVINCVYHLSLGLDNYEGHYISYEPLDCPKPVPIKNQTRLSENGMFFQLHSFMIDSSYGRLNKSTACHYTCAYNYRQNYTLVRHDRPIPQSVAYIKSTIFVVTDSARLPIFLVPSIEVNDDKIKQTLRETKCLVAALYDNNHPVVPTVELLAEALWGSFIILVPSLESNISVLLGHKESKTIRKCSITKTSLNVNEVQAIFWTGTIEENAGGMFAIMVHYKCNFFLGDWLLVLSSYASITNRLEVEVLDSLFEGIPFEPKDGSSSERLVKGVLRLAHLQLRWRGTVLLGESIQIPWSRLTNSSQSPHCKYAINTTAKAMPLNETLFSIDDRRKEDYYVLHKSAAIEEDSGLYICQECDGCSLSEPRRLVVLSKEKWLVMLIDFGKETIVGTGSLSKPYITSADSVHVSCTINIYQGLVVSHTVDDIATLPPMEHFESKRTITKFDHFNRYTTAHEVDTPIEHKKGQVFRFTCSAIVSKFVSDPMDMFAASLLSPIALVKQQYLIYQTLMRTKILPQLIQTTETKLTKEFSNPNTEFYVNNAPDDFDKPIKVAESICKVKYTMFLGYPDGWTRMWSIKRSESNTLILIDCQIVQNWTVTHKNASEEILLDPLFVSQNGERFMHYEYKCIINEPVVALIMLTFSSRKNESQKKESEDLMARWLTDWFQKRREALDGAAGGITMAPSDIRKIRDISIRTVRLDVKYRGSVRIGENVSWIGFDLNESLSVICYYSPNGDLENEYREVPDNFQYDLTGSENPLHVHIHEARYSDSGTYKCTYTTRCTDCGDRRDSIEPRQLIVMPDESILQMHLNHEPLIENQLSVAQFNQCRPDNTPFLRTRQSISVRCIHQISPVHSLQARVKIISKMMSKSQAIRDKVHFTYNSINGTPMQIDSQMAIAPTGLLAKGPLIVTCQLIYHPQEIPNDVSPGRGKVLLQKSRTIYIDIRSPAFIYPRFSGVNIPGLLERWTRGTDRSWTFDQFQNSVSLKRLEEGPMQLSLVQCLGVPRGSSGVWVLFRYKKELIARSCEQQSTQQLRSQQLPLLIKRHSVYRKSGGRNFVNTTFNCLLQPRHVALVMMAYTNYTDDQTAILLQSQWMKVIVGHLKKWLNTPTNEETLILEESTGNVELNYAVVKLNIGWKATVLMDQPWRIWVIDYPVPNIQLKIFHQRDENSAKTIWTNETTHTKAFSIGHTKALISHSGIYSCLQTSIGFGEDMCFQPRKLHVISKQESAHLYINTRLLNSTEPVVRHFPNKHIGTGQEAFFYCVHMVPDKQTSLKYLQFTFQIKTATIDQSGTYLAYERLLPLREEKMNEGVQITHVFRIKAPQLTEQESKLRIECVMQFDHQAFDSADMNEATDKRVVIGYEELDYRLWLNPIVFARFTSSSHPIVSDWLRGHFVEATNSLAFHQSASAELIAESGITLTLIASYGTPIGAIHTTIIIPNGNSYTEEACVMRKQQKLTESQLPIDLHRLYSFDPAHRKSIYEVKFECNLRVENVALVSLVFSALDGQDIRTVKKEVLNNLFAWISRVSEPTTDVIIGPPDPVSGLLTTYMVAKLNVGWNATVRIGEPIKFIAYRGSVRDNVSCTYIPHKNNQSEPLGPDFTYVPIFTGTAYELFKKKASYQDSGTYKCQYEVPTCPICGHVSINNRHLLVLPDNSITKLFLTQDSLGVEPEFIWAANYSVCDVENKPLLFTDNQVWFHCRNEESPRTAVQVTTVIKLYAKYANDPPERISLKSVTRLHRPNNSTLISTALHADIHYDYGLGVIVTCEWRFDLPIQDVHDLQPNPSSRLIVLNENRFVLVLLHLSPIIHHALVKASDKSVQRIVQHQNGAPESSVDFHALEFTSNGSERMFDMHVPISLGIPRGLFVVWTVYEWLNELYLEQCVRLVEVNMTGGGIPQSIRATFAHMDREENVINVSVRCSLRWEQKAVILFSQNMQNRHGLEDKEHYINQTMESLLTNVAFWLANTRSRDIRHVRSDPVTRIAYCLFKVNTTWSNVFSIGSQALILGYLPITGERVKIVCSYSYNKTYTVPADSRQFMIISKPHLHTFYLTKPFLTFKDTGSYRCTWIPVYCYDCTPRLGFMPRQLTVVPDASLVSIYLSHEFSNPGKRSFVQCLQNMVPFLWSMQYVFVYCFYHKKIHSNSTYEFKMFMSNDTAVEGNVQETLLQPMHIMDQQSDEGMTHVYRLRAPSIRNIRGPIRGLCSAHYPKFKMQFNKTNYIHVQPFVAPVLFSEHFSSKEKRITEALVSNLKHHPTNAIEFHTSGLSGYQLQGKVSIHYIVGLGIPRGTSSLNLLCLDKGIVRRRQCTVTEAVELTNKKGTIPPSISSSNYYHDTSGRGLFQYSVICPLTTDVVGMLLVASNHIRPGTSSAAVMADFFQTIYSTLDRWLKHPENNDTSNTISASDYSLMQYSIFRLEVKWRGVVRTDDRFIIFGIIGPPQQGKLFCFFAHSLKTLKSGLLLDLTQSDEMIVNVDRKSGTFEIIYRKATLDHAGVYACRQAHCAHCGSFMVTTPHHLVVIPRQLEMQVHFSRQFSRKHDHLNSDWVLNQTDRKGRPFIYIGQPFMIVCDCHFPLGLQLVRRVEAHGTLLMVNKRDTADLDGINCDSNEILDEGSDSYVAVLKYCMLSVPSWAKTWNLLRISCALRLESLEGSIEDINWKEGQIRLTGSRQLVLKDCIHPRVINSSIRTSDEAITQALKIRYGDDSSITATEFGGGRFGSSMTEGLLTVKFHRTGADPVAWSGVYSIYNHSGTFSSRKCILDLDHYRSRNKLNKFGFIQLGLIEKSIYHCILTMEHVALLVYTIHYPYVQRRHGDFIATFLPEVTYITEQWLQGKRNPLKLPTDTRGDFRLVVTRVDAAEFVKNGEYVRMYGLLEPLVPGYGPECVYGYSETRKRRTDSKGFSIHMNVSWNFFILAKPKIQFIDSGLYSCTFLSCVDCPDVGIGFDRRKLTVLADDSILHMTVTWNLTGIPSNSQGDWNEEVCKTFPIVYLSPGDLIDISCSHVVPEVTSLDKSHVLSYQVEASQRVKILKVTAHGNSSMDLFSLVTNASIQVPEFGDYSKWLYIYCQLRDRDDQKTDIVYANRLVEQWLTASKSFKLLHKKTPSILHHTVIASNGLNLVELQRVTQLELGRLGFLASGTRDKQIHEDWFQVVFVADLGIPMGWTFIRLYYRRPSDGEIVVDQCQELNPSTSKNTATVGVPMRRHRSICVIQPEHVALLMVAVHQPQTIDDTFQVEQYIAHAVLRNLSNWLGNITHKDTKSRNMCLRYSHRLVRLNIGWNGIVYTGQTIRMQVKLTGNTDMSRMICYYNSKDELTGSIILPTQFHRKVDKTIGRLTLTHPKAEPEHTGEYYCTDASSPKNTMYVGMFRRRLIVLPDKLHVDCELSLDEAGKTLVRKNQRLKNGTGYILSSSTAFVHCTFEVKSLHLYSVEYRMMYEQMDKVNGRSKVMPTLMGGTLISHRLNKSRLYQVYRIVAPRVETYMGSLRVTCSSTFNNLTSSRSIVSLVNDSFKLQEVYEFTIQEPANGVLHLSTLNTLFEHGPVPLGSEFTCGGGLGLPELQYTWTRVFPKLYTKRATVSREASKLASILPANGGGWGGPEHPFVDMPEEGLQSDGSVLRVPTDPRYRGMNYMYRCEGSNVVKNIRHSINLTVHLSILICETDEVIMDLSILVSPKLMSACDVSSTREYQSLMHYGHFFNPLVRQLLLGFPFRQDAVRISFIRPKHTETKLTKWRTQFEWTQFSPLLTRFAFAVTLYSREHKPISDRSGCISNPDNLLDILKTIKTLHYVGFKTYPVFLLTVDGSLRVDPSEELTEVLKYLKKNKMKIILALTHKRGGQFASLEAELMDLLRPEAVVELLPHFHGAMDCVVCKYNPNRREFHVTRLALFDALCSSAHSYRFGPIRGPHLSYSLPPSLHNQGVALMIMCAGETVYTTNYGRVSDMNICFISENAAANLTYENQKVNMQQITKACREKFVFHRKRLYPEVQSLRQKMSDSRSGGGGGESEVHSISGKHVLKLNAKYPIVLCYQRLGGMNIKLFDVFNFTHNLLRVQPVKLNEPTLKATHLAEFETGASQFHCSHPGLVLHMEFVLLFHSAQSSTHSTYHIIDRVPPKFHPGTMISSANLTALELQQLPWQSKGVGSFICLIHPIPNERIETNFTKLSPRSGVKQYSQPYRVTRPKSGCPTAPRLSISMRDSQPKLGTQMQASCHTDGVSSLYPTKLFHLTETNSTIVCSRLDSPMDTKTRQATCQWVACDNCDCNDAPGEVYSSMPLDSTDNSITCSASYALVKSWTLKHQVQFVIKHLRTGDLGSKIFCRVMYPHVSLDSGDPGEAFIRQELTSRVYNVHFYHDPLVVSFEYNPNLYSWSCRMKAFPLPIDPNIRLEHADSIWLVRQLSTFTVRVNQTQPEVQYEEELSTSTESNSTSLGYSVLLKYAPSIDIPGGLTRGMTKLYCGTAKFGKILDTQVGYQFEEYDSLLPKSPMIEGQHKWFDKVCVMPSPSRNRLQSMSLHRSIEPTKWLEAYDVTLLVADLTNQSPMNHRSALDTLSVPFHSFGPWARLNKRAVRVLVDRSNETIVMMDITKLVGFEYDSGSYFCTGRYQNRQLLTTMREFRILKGTPPKMISFGYQTLSGPRIWYRSNHVTHDGDILTLRCVVWTTDPSDRSFGELRISSNDKNNNSRKGFEIKHIVQDSSIHSIEIEREHAGIVIRSIERSYRVHSRVYNSLGPFSCQLTDSQQILQLTHYIQPPRIECLAPTNLRISHTPIFGYRRTDIVSFSANLTCTNVTYQWVWVAGPIPQLTAELGEMHGIRYSQANRLYLNRLPRSGTYIFTCIAQCNCDNDSPLSTALQTSIFVQSDELELRHRQESEPEDEQLDPLHYSDQVVSVTDSLREAYFKLNFSSMNDSSVLGGKRLNETLIDVQQEQEQDHEPPVIETLIEPRRKQTVDADLLKRVRHVCQPYVTRIPTGHYWGCAVRRNREQQTVVSVPDMVLRRPFYRENQDEPNLVDQRVLTKPLSRVNSSQFDNFQISKVTYQPEIPASGLYGRLNMKRRAQSTLVDIFSSSSKRTTDRSKSVQPSHRILPSLSKPSRILQNQSDNGYTLWMESQSRLHSSEELRGRAWQRSHESSRAISKDETRDIGAIKWNSQFQHMNQMLEIPTGSSLTLLNRLSTPLNSLGLKSHLRPEERLQTTYSDPHNRDSRRSVIREVSMEDKLKSGSLGSETKYSKRKPYSTWQDPQTLVSTEFPSIPFSSNENNLSDKHILTNQTLLDDRYLMEHATLAENPQMRLTLRDYEPSTRNDLERQKHDQDESKTPWWQRLVNWQRREKSHRSILRDIPDRKTTKEEADYYTPGDVTTRRIRKMQKSVYNQLLSLRNMNGTITRRDHSPTTKSREHVHIEPKLVALPAQTTVICPFTHLHHSYDYTMTHLSWDRYATLTSPEPEHIIRITMGQRKRFFRSPRFFNPSRVFTYSISSTSPSWPGLTPAFTFDIRPLQLADYGFYVCKFTFQRVSSKRTFQVSRIPTHPLCIVSEPSQPLIRLAQPNDTNPDEWIELLPSTNDSSFRPGIPVNSRLIVHCEAEPYRMFCELADGISNGTRLIQTQYDLYIHPSPGKHGMDGFDHRIQLPDPDSQIAPLIHKKSRRINLNSRAWSIHIEPDHWGAMLRCHIRPLLQSSVFGTLSYKSELQRQFDEKFAQTIARQSKAVYLNVSGIELRVTIIPPPQSELHDHFTVVYIRGGQKVQCNFESYKQFGPMYFTLRAIQRDKWKKLTMEDLSDWRGWLDDRKTTHDWHRSDRVDEITVWIPMRSSAQGPHLANCSVPSANLSTIFLLTILPPSSDLTTISGFVRLSIKRAWIIVLTPLAIFMYVLLRRQWYERQYRELRRVTAMLHDVDTDASDFLDAVV